MSEMQQFFGILERESRCAEECDTLSDEVRKRSQMRLIFDVDGVFADFSTAYADLLIKVDGKDRLPAGWRTNPDLHTPTWFWERFYGYSKQVEEEVWNTHIIPSKDFWYELEPYPGAGEALGHINKLAKSGHEVIFLTNRMGKDAKKQTEDWLMNVYDGNGKLKGIDNPTVLLSGDKTPILRALKANFYIDDKAETVVDVASLVGPEFTLYVKDAPYNRDVQYPNGKVKHASSVKDALEQSGLW